MQDFIHSGLESLFVFLHQLDPWVLVVSLTLVVIGYIFGNKMYQKYNDVSLFAAWVGLTVTAVTEFANIILSPDSHPNEIFASVAGILFSAITTITLVLALRKKGSLLQLWKESDEDDKKHISFLGKLMFILCICELAPWGDILLWEFAMIFLVFKFDFAVYKVIKDAAFEAPETQSFMFWLLLFIGVMWFNVTQIYLHYDRINQLGSIGLLVYLENAILFFFCARVIFKAKYPGGIKEGLAIAKS